MHRETECAGVMIARGSFGQPWVFAQARALLDGVPAPPSPSIEERFAVALAHVRLVQSYDIDPAGAAIEFRKHLGWYVKGLPNSAELRRRLHVVNGFDEVAGLFEGYMEERAAFARAAGEAGEAAGEAFGRAADDVVTAVA
jgi:tRNA-dihydrouridine synthase